MSHYVLECCAPTRDDMSTQTAPNFLHDNFIIPGPLCLVLLEAELCYRHCLIKRALLYSAGPDTPVFCRVQRFPSVW